MYLDIAMYPYQIIETAVICLHRDEKSNGSISNNSV